MSKVQLWIVAIATLVFAGIGFGVGLLPQGVTNGPQEFEVTLQISDEYVEGFSGGTSTPGELFRDFSEAANRLRDVANAIFQSQHDSLAVTTNVYRNSDGELTIFLSFPGDFDRVSVESLEDVLLPLEQRYEFQMLTITGIAELPILDDSLAPWQKGPLFALGFGLFFLLSIVFIRTLLLAFRGGRSSSVTAIGNFINRWQR